MSAAHIEPAFAPTSLHDLDGANAQLVREDRRVGPRRSVDDLIAQNRAVDVWQKARIRALEAALRAVSVACDGPVRRMALDALVEKSREKAMT